MKQIPVRAHQFDMDGNAFFIDTKAHVKILKGSERIAESLNSEGLAHYHNTGVEIEYSEEGLEDFRNDEILLKDFQDTLDANRFGYSEEKLRNAFLHADEVSINTARGHSAAAIKKALKMYIMQKFDTVEKEFMIQNIRNNIPGLKLASFEEALDAYFNERVVVYAVKSSEFGEMLGIDNINTTVENLKPQAYHHYLDRLIDKYGSSQMITVGFSEDTEKYLTYVADYIRKTILTNPKYDHIYPKLFHTISPEKYVGTVLRSKREITKNFWAKK